MNDYTVTQDAVFPLQLLPEKLLIKYFTEMKQNSENMQRKPLKDLQKARRAASRNNLKRLQ